MLKPSNLKVTALWSTSKAFPKVDFCMAGFAYDSQRDERDDVAGEAVKDIFRQFLLWAIIVTSGHFDHLSVKKWKLTSRIVTLTSLTSVLNVSVSMLVVKFYVDRWYLQRWKKLTAPDSSAARDDKSDAADKAEDTSQIRSR